MGASHQCSNATFTWMGVCLKLGHRIPKESQVNNLIHGSNISIHSYTYIHNYTYVYTYVYIIIYYIIYIYIHGYQWGIWGPLFSDRAGEDFLVLVRRRRRQATNPRSYQALALWRVRAGQQLGLFENRAPPNLIVISDISILHNIIQSYAIIAIVNLQWDILDSFR